MWLTWLNGLLATSEQKISEPLKVSNNVSYSAPPPWDQPWQLARDCAFSLVPLMGRPAVTPQLRAESQSFTADLQLMGDMSHKQTFVFQTKVWTLIISRFQQNPEKAL